MNDGDWVCPDSQCGNVNFARRSACNRCGKEKEDSQAKKLLGHEIGKAAAEKSKGLFSADDWQCSKCGNVNWARRGTCNMCNAPKFCEVEERTGYGGGYNERGTVEYKEREDSDGEFDEFGRKKKKKKDSVSSNSAGDSGRSNPSIATANKVVEPEEEDEEDEEESGSEADLSKYDLSGWGEDDDSDNKDAKPERSRSNSRSSSSRSPSTSRSAPRKHSNNSRSRSSSYESRSNNRQRSRSPINSRKGERSESDSRR